MARKSPSRMELRKEAEAAEKTPKGKRKKATKKKSSSKSRKRRSEKSAQRKRLLWGVFSGSMKEEARFPYNERKEAEKKAEQLRSKSKKLYFVQPIKEPISETPSEGESASGSKSETKKKSAKTSK